jgi:hypothetical protein
LIVIVNILVHHVIPMLHVIDMNVNQDHMIEMLYHHLEVVMIEIGQSQRKWKWKWERQGWNGWGTDELWAVDWLGLA